MYTIIEHHIYKYLIHYIFKNSRARVSFISSKLSELFRSMSATQSSKTYLKYTFKNTKKHLPFNLDMKRAEI